MSYAGAGGATRAKQQMTIGRYLFIAVLALGLIASARLVSVTHDYTRAIDTLRRLEIEVVEVRRPAPDILAIQLEIRNRSSFPVTVQYLFLNLVDDQGRLGATYDRIPATQVEPGAAARVPATIRLLFPDRLPDEPPPSLRFRGEWQLQLPLSERFFRQSLSITWEGGS